MVEIAQFVLGSDMAGPQGLRWVHWGGEEGGSHLLKLGLSLEGTEGLLKA